MAQTRTGKALERQNKTLVGKPSSRTISPTKQPVTLTTLPP